MGDATVAEVVAKTGTEERLAVLRAATRRVTEVDVAVLDEPQLVAELQATEDAIRQLSARQSRLVAERTRRETSRERHNGTEPAKAAARAGRRVRRELSREFGWTPAQAKQAQRAGEEADSSPDLKEAFDRGRLPAVHVRILFDTLRHLTGQQRSEAEAELLASATQQHAVEFRRTCQRLLARLDHDTAADVETRRHDRRTGRVCETEDGMLWASARVAGLDKALVTSAFKAFRRPDAHGERRSAEQATADAFVAICQAALQAATAPTDGGVRPYVTVTIPYQTLLEQAGVVEVDGAGPLPFAEIRRLLADCGVSRLLTDPRGVPVEAGEQVRTVPRGLRRILNQRDRTCIADGCDTPAAWCDVMHLDTPYRLGGRLSPDQAALGCKEHHYKYDRRGWTITWTHGRPILHHPRTPPDPPSSERDPATVARETSAPYTLDPDPPPRREHGRSSPAGRDHPERRARRSCPSPYSYGFTAAERLPSPLPAEREPVP